MRRGPFNERKNFMKAILALLLVFVSASAWAVPPRRYYQDMYLPTQSLLEHQTIANPAAAGTANVLNGNYGATSAAAATVTVFVAQPDVPRNLVITPGGTTTDIENCNIVVTGTNYAGSVISETFAFLANATDATVGNKAFKAIASVVFPANCESGGFAATWSIGYGAKLGLKRCAANPGALAWSTFDGAYETTRGTLANHVSDMASNTFTPNGTPNGAKSVEVYFVQNFACFE